MIIHYNNEDLKELIKEGVCIVDFYADWCGPCMMLSPLLEEISNECNIKLIKVDVDKYTELAKDYRVMSIPSVFIYKDGELKNNFVGFKDKNSIKEIVENF